jgi:hypothetical protein
MLATILAARSFEASLEGLLRSFLGHMSAGKVDDIWSADKHSGIHDSAFMDPNTVQPDASAGVGRGMV